MLCLLLLKVSGRAPFFQLLYTPPVYPRRAVYTIPRVTDRAWVCGGVARGLLPGLWGLMRVPGSPGVVGQVRILE